MSRISYPYIKEASKEYEKCLGKKMAIFPLEWIAYENYVNKYQYKRTKETDKEVMFCYSID